jgi:rod shape determining protein RodA
VQPKPLDLLRATIIRIDWFLLGALIVLSAISLLNMHSAGPSFLPKQATYFAIGYLLLVIVANISRKKIYHYCYLCYLGAVFLLIITLFFGKTAGGSQRWLDFGLFQLQPSEPAKLFLILALARYFSGQAKHYIGLRELIVPILLMALPFYLVLRQPDLGTALMFAAILFSVLLVVRIKPATLILLLGTLTVSAPLAWFFVLHDYQQRRVINWFLSLLGLHNDPMGEGYQVLQAKIAIGSGGWFGKGYLQGTQSHLHFLPERHTDFIMAVYAEEWGFMGCTLLMACYLAILLRCLQLATQVKDLFSFYAVFGIGQMLFWQILVNMLMVLGMLPVVGVPLPLLSFGGSSLITTFLSLGCLFSFTMDRHSLSSKQRLSCQ